MAKETPKTPAGIRRFKAMLEVVANVPKAEVEARIESLKKAAKKSRGKKK